ncbi:ATP-binding cassette domain-containing protein [Pararobbsia silviterrae]|uniref:ATP-binding cassette domain-containing protein n=1 Tax=Pararobbsia silviterrae TaxID=1792498 RepID=A0A494Y0U0_9BURK|nr:ATP-binding cassette domain-containing protein [Pararobbsia silviterrae]RKP55859.1 ATP-binding cassette domain-containing protein [Pararobbsia silviterrae]
MNLPRPLAWLGALLAIYLIAPLATVVPQLAVADWTALREPALWHAARVSFASATLATLLIGLGGVPLGYALARHTGRVSRVLGVLVQLPLVLPPLVAGVLLLFLLGPYSRIGGWAVSLGLPLTDSFAGVTCAEVFVAAPFLIVAARSAFASIDRDLEHVAATLGHRAWARFFKVSLPLAWPTIAAGLLLAWLRAMGEFGATVMVAYHPYSLPVFTFVSFGSQGLAQMLPILVPTVLSVVAVVSAIGVVRLQRVRFSREGRAARAIERATEHAAGQADQDAHAMSDARARIDTTPSLDLELRHRYRTFELDLTLHTRARRIAVLGPSGSGKSLSLRLLAGLEGRAGESIVRIDGARIDPVDPEARRIGYVPQHYALFPHLRVAEQLLFAADASPERAAFWARRFELTPLLDRLPSQLSLGQQQRVALARALSRSSRLLLLDEPFAALDTPLRTRMRRALRALQRDYDGTMLIVTHDPQDAAELSDEIVVMSAGRVLQHGAAAELFRRPGSLDVARLLGVENVFEARVQTRGQIVVPVEGAADIAFESSACELADGAPCLVRIPARALVRDARGLFEAVVDDRVEMPNRVCVMLRMGDLVFDWIEDGHHDTSSRATPPPNADPSDIVVDIGTRRPVPAVPVCAPGTRHRFSIDAAQIDVWPKSPGVLTRAASVAPIARAAAASNPR